MKKTGKTEQALLTYHKPEPQVSRRPPESTTLATSPIIYCSSIVCLWLAAYIPLESRETQNWLRPCGPMCLRPDPSSLATRQAPSIRVHYVGHAAHYILHLSCVLLWLPAYLPRMPLECRGTRYWLRPGGPTCLRPNPTPL
uniref:cDNA n=1 Tax=Mesocestoides corti TaxID=53468 RepID=A0A5K3FW61_MESCO